MTFYKEGWHITNVCQPSFLIELKDPTRFVRYNIRLVSCLIKHITERINFFDLLKIFYH